MPRLQRCKMFSRGRFHTAEAMSDHQANREVKEAMRFGTMSPSDKYVWLTENWDPLQAAASSLYSRLPQGVATVRYFATPEEKNRFDEDREIERALQMQMIEASPEAQGLSDSGNGPDGDSAVDGR